MITDKFVNSCFKLLLNKDSVAQKNQALYRDVKEMVEEWQEKETVEIPLTFKTKVDLLIKMCDMLKGGKTIESTLDSLLESQKYKSHGDFLNSVISADVSKHEFDDIIRQIRLRKKVSAIFANYDDLSKIVDEIKDGSFDSLDDLADDYEVIIQKLYTNMMDSKRSVTLEAAASLDLVGDDYEHVIEMIKKKYESKNKTPSGIKIFDNDVMHGGFEPSRLYIIGGGSGAGKSTLMNNMIINSATTETGLMSQDEEYMKRKKVYIYISLENTIEESLMRTYQPLFVKTKNEMLSDISQGVDIKQKVVDSLKKTNSSIIMKYFPGYSIGVMDLRGVLDDAISVYGKGSIAGLYLDYLDLMKGDTRYDMYRLELGHIALALKSLAVEYNIPVISASQLTRAAYRIKDAAELGVDQMSESIKKVEHADFVMLLALDQTDPKKVYAKVGKNRAGKNNVALEFHVEFDKFKFYEGKIAANKKKADSCSAGHPLTGFDSI